MFSPGNFHLFISGEWLQCVKYFVVISLEYHLMSFLISCSEYIIIGLRKKEKNNISRLDVFFDFTTGDVNNRNIMFAVYDFSVF